MVNKKAAPLVPLKKQVQRVCDVCDIASLSRYFSEAILKCGLMRKQIVSYYL